MNRWRHWILKPEGITAGLLLGGFGLAAIFSPYFLDARYLLDATSLYMEAGLLIIAMTFVIIGGQIDLSVASILALSACGSLALQQRLEWSPWQILWMAPLIGAALGFFNGWLVAQWRLPALAVTLATMALFRGAAQVFAGDHSLKMDASMSGLDWVKLPGTLIPLPLVLFFGAAVVGGLVLHKTVYGRWVFAVGTNEKSAWIAGVPVRRVQWVLFTVSGAVAGIAAVLFCSRLGVARFDHARGMELDVITAVVLGGASIFGGRGSMLGSVLALFLVMIIRTALGVANVKSENQLAVMGLLLIGAVLLSQWFERLHRVAPVKKTARLDGAQKQPA